MAKSDCIRKIPPGVNKLTQGTPSIIVTHLSPGGSIIYLTRLAPYVIPNLGGNVYLFVGHCLQSDFNPVKSYVSKNSFVNKSKTLSLT